MKTQIQALGRADLAIIMDRLLDRARQEDRWGVPSIFIGRFFGPLRASVPLAAGIFEMPYWSFQIANFVSALIWSATLLLFGDVIARTVQWLWRAI